MENKRGNGIFLGIVSIATLIVAIIGATFAYFSATTESDPNAVNLQAYEYSLSMSVSQVWEFSSGLIPLNPTTSLVGVEAPNNTNLSYAINVGNELGKKCVDDNGLQVCALYAVEISNTATNDVTLTGQIRTTSNQAGGKSPTATAFENLTYQEIDGTPDDGFSIIGSPLQLDHTNPEGEEPGGTIEIADIIVPGTTDPSKPGKATTYVLIYLNDTGEDQSDEMGAKYEGQLIYTSEGGVGNTLTGTFRVSGTEQEDDEE